MAGAVIFEITRPYRPENPIDEFVDGIIGRRPMGDEIVDEDFPIYFVLPSDSEFDGLNPVSEGRLGYGDDEMAIIVPSLDLNQAVQGGTSQAALKKGPGLFETSGMPGQPGANVSIAGHRNRDAFYYLDRLGKDDRVYLIYESYTYTYVYYDTRIVLPADWDVVSEQGFDACTLITCTPIGKADKRMAVRFILESVAQNGNAAINEFEYID